MVEVEALGRDVVEDACAALAQTLKELPDGSFAIASQFERPDPVLASRTMRTTSQPLPASAEP